MRRGWLGETNPGQGQGQRTAGTRVGPPGPEVPSLPPCTCLPPAGSTRGAGFLLPMRAHTERISLEENGTESPGSTPRQPRPSRFKKVIIELYSKHNEDHMIADPVNWKVTAAQGSRARRPHRRGTHTSALSAARTPAGPGPPGPPAPRPDPQASCVRPPGVVNSPQSSLPPMVRPAADFSSKC